jgi:chromosomal replication initiator protein
MNPAKRREDIHALMNYRWSSNYYYLGKKVKPEWLETSKILNLFSTNRRQQKALYKEFISDRIPDEIKKIYSRKKLSPVIGDDSFKEWIKKTFLERKAEEHEIPEAGKRETGPPAEQIVDIVKAWYKVEDQDLKCRRRGIRNEPRQVAVFLCRQMSGLSLNEIKILFDMGAYTTASMAIQSIKNRLTVEQRFRRRIEKIKKKILDAT